MKGLFGYYQLINWWETSFSPDETQSFKQLYKYEEDFNSLFCGEVDYCSQTVVGFLQNLGYNLAHSKNFDLAFKFLQAGEQLLTKGTAADIHFLFRGFLEYYSEFSPYHNQEKLVEYAEKQVGIAAIASKEIMDKSTWYRVGHNGYELYYEFLLLNNRKEEAKALKAKAKKEKWNCIS